VSVRVVCLVQVVEFPCFDVGRNRNMPVTKEFLQSSQHSRGSFFLSGRKKLI